MPRQVMTVLPGALLATVKQLVNMAKVETDDSDNEIVATAQLLSGANNLVIFYGSAGLGICGNGCVGAIAGQFADDSEWQQSRW